MTSETDELERKRKLGDKIAHRLYLVRTRNGRWRTDYGKKSSAGLYTMLVDFIKEAEGLE